MNTCGQLVITILLFTAVSFAQIPRQINYQGMLANPTTSTPVTGTYNIQFSIYSDETTTTSLWTETQVVAVNNGLFSVMLGSVNPIALTIFDEYDKYLGVKIQEEPELVPRQKLTSVGYAFQSYNTKMFDGYGVQQFSPSSHNHNADYYQKSELLNSDGQPNQSTDLVSWNKLKDIPEGFSDGVDNSGTASGGITQIGAGSGLAISNPNGPTATIELDVDHNDGTVNQSGDPISWSKIKDIPAGIADGVDDIGSSSSGITQINAGTGLAISNPTGPTSTITLSMGHSNGIDADMVDGRHANDFSLFSHNHNSDYYNKAEVNTNDGSQNQPDDPISWTKLKDVPADFADGTDNGGGVHNHFGEGWVGNTNSIGFFVQNTGGGRGITAQSTSNYGLYAISETETAVYGTSNNIGVHGTGTNIGVSGYTSGNENSTGVSGGATTGKGVYGTSNSGNGVYGNSFSGYGVYGTSENSDGIYGYSASHAGISGTSTSSSGISGTSTSGQGVSGVSIAGSGVQGTSTNGFGLYGYSNTLSGVYGFSTNSYGVNGFSTNSTGIYGTGTVGVHGGGNTIGVSGNSESGTGIYGVSPGGKAAVFDGQVEVHGTLSKSAGSFKIDHPLDPANKYLQHSFVESPDMKNIYDGTVTLNSNGEAVIELPNWFEALNKDFRYQLTCIGGYSQVYIAQEVSYNQFRIAGGTPNLKVSWQVTGTRKDEYAEAHRIQVEVDKTSKEAGKYIFPELFNQPKERGINYEDKKRIEQIIKSPEN